MRGFEPRVASVRGRRYDDGVDGLDNRAGGVRIARGTVVSPHRDPEVRGALDGVQNVVAPPDESPALPEEDVCVLIPGRPDRLPAGDRSETIERDVLVRVVRG